MCDHPGMDMTLRFEILPQDLDVIVDFYTRVLGFSVTKDQRGDRLNPPGLGLVDH